MATSSAGTQHNITWARVPWLPVSLLLCLLPLCFLGLGTDNDTYGVVQCGYSTWKLHLPCTSRHPGYWVYEAIVYVLVRVGGATLSNLGSFTMAALLVWRFWMWSVRLKVRYPSLMAAALIVTPAFAIAATSTDDYLWSLLPMVLGAQMILADRLIAASLLSALSMAIRGANVPIVAGGFAAAIAYEAIRQRRVTLRSLKLALSGLSSALLAAAAFYPSYRLAGRNMSFTRALDRPELYRGWLRLAKFAYKGQLVVGPLAVLVIVIAAVLYVRHRPLGRRSTEAPAEAEARSIALFLGYLLGNIALFLRYPIEFFYLIPALFFFLLLASITLFAGSRSLSIALFLSILSANFLLPVFAEPNVPGRSTGGHLHLGVRTGALLEDIRLRIPLLGCYDFDCFEPHARKPGVQ